MMILPYHANTKYIDNNYFMRFVFSEKGPKVCKRDLFRKKVTIFWNSPLKGKRTDRQFSDVSQQKWTIIKITNLCNSGLDKCFA